MIVQRVIFENSKKQNLVGMVRVPQSYDQSIFPVVLVLHGYKENKDRDIIVALADHLSHLGFVTLRFDFAGHGESDGDLENFSISNQTDDVVSAVKYLYEQDFVNKNLIGIVGHSWGGNIGIFAASKYSVQSLVTIAARSSTDHFISSHFSPDEIEELSKKGTFVTHDFKTMSSDFLVDFKKYDIKKSASKIKCPWLILHGTDDKRAPYSEARELYSYVPEKIIDIVEMADHTFSGEHRQYLLDTVGNWFLKTMK